MLVSGGQPQDFGIHWFRRDLRITGSQALLENVAHHGGRVLGVFFIDRTFLARPDFSRHRFHFFLKTLLTLQSELRRRGGDLLIIGAPPAQGFPRLMDAIGAAGLSRVTHVSFHRDYEPFARQRDEAMALLFQQRWPQVKWVSRRDHLLLEPGEVLKDDGTPYQVYTPFYKRWLSRALTPEVQERLQSARQPLAHDLKIKWHQVLGPTPPADLADVGQELLEKTPWTLPDAPPAPGGDAAWTHGISFTPHIESYGTRRDFPYLKATSGLSVYFKNGSLTGAQVIHQMGLLAKGRPPRAGSGAETFLKELVWREFYYHILAHWPRVQDQAFIEKYADIAWPNNENYFQRWIDGQTGYPIVDAGMRQLKQTGLMHNRVRMIVASFLTKDLLVDWRWGERYFMNTLLDGDLAPNNGGWQWAASTGCDPQPYFRIFNPILQGQKFDPEGEYVKTWVPELARRPLKQIHLPLDPVVIHEEQKPLALKLFSGGSPKP